MPERSSTPLRFSCDDPYTREALDQFGGQWTPAEQTAAAVIRVDVQRQTAMTRHVHPAVLLNAVTLLGGYFVFFFRVETEVVSHAIVRWEDGKCEAFTAEQKGRYFHPGYLRPPPNAPRPDLFYDDVRNREYLRSSEAIARQIVARAAERRH